MPDTKQLIAGFLLLAAVATSAAFLFPLTPASRVAGPGAPGTRDERGAVPANVFIERPDLTILPAQEPNVVPGVFPEDAAVEDNLTNRLVAMLGLKIAETNPDGPRNPDGTLNLSAIDTEELAAYFAENAGPNAELPDWEAEINRQHIAVRTQYTTEHLNAYNKDVNELLEMYGPQAGRLSGSILPSAAAVQAIPLAAAYRRGTEIVAPEPAAGFHWSLTKLLAYQAKASELAKLAETDPIRASLILQAQEQNYLNAVQVLVNETQRTTDIRGLSVETSGMLLLALQRTFGVETAHAQWLVVAPAEIARMVWEFIKKVITEQLKDRLVHRLMQQTIKWVQGGGKPQFLTNWKGFLGDVAKDEAGRLVDRFAPRLCQSFGPLIRVAMIPVDPSKDFDAGPTCTIDQVVGNIRAFAQSFENGGWIAYGAAMQPSNNFFGAMIQMSDIASLEGTKQKEAKKTDTESSSGFLSSKECIKWTSEYKQCVDSLPAGSTLKCSDRMDKNDNICVDYRNTTPGETLTGAIKDSSAAPLLRIVNADDLAALINALINAALTKLVKLGASTVSKGLLGLNMSADDYEEAKDKCEGLPAGASKEGCAKEWTDVKCTKKTLSAPVTVDVTGTTGPLPGGGGAGACPDCGSLGGSCCAVVPADATNCINSGQSQNLGATPDCQNGCFAPPGTTPNTCGGGGGGGGTAPVSGTGSGSVALPNGADCTGGPTDPGGGGPSGGSCDNENCNNPACLCKVRDQITPSDFCYLDDINNAIQAVVDEWKAQYPNGDQDASRGLVGAPYDSDNNPANGTSCDGDYTRPCVFSAEAFKDAVINKLTGLTVVKGEEICVSGGPCDKPNTCSYGSPIDCRPGLQHAPGDACVGTARRECSKIESSLGTIMWWNANSVCPL